MAYANKLEERKLGEKKRSYGNYRALGERWGITKSAFEEKKPGEKKGELQGVF